MPRLSARPSAISAAATCSRRIYACDSKRTSAATRWMPSAPQPPGSTRPMRRSSGYPAARSPACHPSCSCAAPEPALLRAQAHPGVWHLVSDVRGTLAPGTGDAELIRATFPPGSVTGAPKVRALEVISELEATPREVYTGAVGYRSPVAGLELNVAIRTFELHGDRVWLGSGGGITAASDPHAEYRECLLKAAPLIRALGATLSEEPASPPPRPRPALGVFTSLRVTRGSCRDLDRHLARLDDSTWRLFGKHVPPGTRADLAARLGEAPSGRLRVTARPRSEEH